MKRKVVVFLGLILLISSCNNFGKKQEQAEELKRKDEQIRSLDSIVKSLAARMNQKDADDAQKIPLTELYQEVKKSVYLLFTANDEGYSQGSAFCIRDDGVCISNYHVFEFASNAVAYNDEGEEFMISEILELDKDRDYIVFKIGPLSTQINALKIASCTPKVGENVFAVGNPEGLTQTLSTGVVSGIRGDGGEIQTTAEITHGSSGGPLFNENGEVVGVTSFGYETANLNFAINIQEIPYHKYLDNNHRREEIVSYSEQKLRAILNEYYKILLDEDMKELSEIYANELARFHSLYSIEKSVAIDDHIKYLKKYDIIGADIIPGTMKVIRSNSEYTLQYKMDYKIVRRKDSKHLSYEIMAFVIINTEGKIKSIFDDILKRK